jgi:hypothetical protein
VTENLPRKLVKRIKGECQHCTEPAVAGSDYCEGHGERERAEDRSRHQERRQELADKGICIASGCGKKVAREEREDGTFKLKRCKACAKEHRGAMKSLYEIRSGVPSADSGVPSKPADPSHRRTARTKIERAYDRLSDGTERTIERVIYRSRGGQTVESMDADGAHDVQDALRLLAGHEGRLRYLRAIEDELGRIQRAEARSAVADPLLRAVGLIAAEAARLYPDGWRLVLERLEAVGNRD